MNGGSNSKKLFAFIVPGFTNKSFNYDTHIIIVDADNENNAYNELSNITKKNIFENMSQYSQRIDKSDLVKHIVDKKIRPIQITAPFYFSFYNG